MELDENSESLESVLNSPIIAHTNLDNGSRSILHHSYEKFETPVGCKRNCDYNDLTFCPPMKKKRLSLFSDNVNDSRRRILFIEDEPTIAEDLTTNSISTPIALDLDSQTNFGANSSNDSESRSNFGPKTVQLSEIKTDNDDIQAKHLTTKRHLVRLLNEEVPMSVGIELAKKHNLIVFKPNFFRFRLAKNL